jgi:outer membrane receptor protein involved in Fe transport|tara:strand:+ start:7657 stop:10083 length:2427 start_codon:yes stop_codon:yes gene_type:complete
MGTTTTFIKKNNHQGSFKQTLLASAIVSSLAATGVQAQSSVMEEVLVTASKREQTLQETPIAVSVVGQDTIEKAAILDINDLQVLVPSLRVNTNQTASATNFSIRGFGGGSNNVGIEPSVAVFIDGVYRSRAGAQIGDLPRLERVEVLRGPQSTLFGKNASAGVISIVTAAPSYETEGKVEAGIGNYNRKQLKGYYTTGLSETLAVSASGSMNTRDGYVERLDGGTDLNERDRWNLRGQALFEPTENVSLRLIVDYSEIDENCCAVTNVFNGASAGAIQFLGGTVLPDNKPFARKSAVSTENVNQIDDGGVSLQLDVDYDTFALTSITSYRKNKGYSGGDVDYTSLDIVRTDASLEIETVTQEFRLTSTAGESFDWMVGGFIFQEDIETDGSTFFGNDFRAYGDVLFGSFPGILSTVEALSGLPAGAILSSDNVASTAFEQDNFAYSLFATGDYHFTDKLTASLGVSYTYDEKEVVKDSYRNNDLYSAVDLVPVLGATPLAGLIPSLQGLQFRPPVIDYPNSVENGETDDDKVTWTARVTYQVNDMVNVYASAATGYKSSSWNIGGASRPFPASEAALDAAGLLVANQSFGTRFASPEEAMVYELGLKASFEQGAFNIAIFDQTIEDFQQNAFDGDSFVLTNAGERSTRGIEFDALYSPTDAWLFNLAGTFMDPKYDSYTGASGIGGAPIDLSGEEPAGIHKENVTASATYRFTVGDGITGYVRTDYIYESDVRAAWNVPEEFSREVSTWNASAGLQFTNGVNVQVWGRNINDDEYYVGVFQGVVQTGTYNAFASAPATYGVNVSYEF